MTSLETLWDQRSDVTPDRTRPEPDRRFSRVDRRNPFGVCTGPEPLDLGPEPLRGQVLHPGVTEGSVGSYGSGLGCPERA